MLPRFFQVSIHVGWGTLFRVFLSVLIACHYAESACLVPSGDTTGVEDLEAFRDAADASDNICFEGGVFYFDSNYYQTTGGDSVPPDCETEVGSNYNLCKDSVVYFKERNNIVVEGSRDEPTIFELVNYDKAGAQLRTSVILLVNCVDVIVQDLTIRHGPNDLDHFVGLVREVRDPNSLVIQVPAASLAPASYHDTDGDRITVDVPSCSEQIAEIQRDVFFAEHFIRLDDNLIPTSWEKIVNESGLEYDAIDLGCSDAGCDDHLVLVEFFWSSWSSCRVPDTSIQYNFQVGDSLMALHEKRVVEGIKIRSVENLNVNRVTFGNIAGEGISGDQVRNLNVDGFQALPGLGSSYWKTLNDAIWIRGYSGTNSVKNMHAERLTDDYVNFHTRLQKLEASHITKDGLCIRIESSVWWFETTPGSFGPGQLGAYCNDIVNLYDKSQSFIWQGMYVGRKEASFPDGTTAWVACFASNADDPEPLSDILSRTTFVTTTKWMPDDNLLENEYALVLQNVTVLNSRARALIQGSHTLLDGITVIDNSMAAVVITSDPDWSEGTPPKHVTIRNSLFDNVAIRKGGFIAAVQVVAPKVDEDLFDGLDILSTAPIFRDITIEDTTFRNIQQTAIFTSGVQGLLLDNVVVQNSDAASLHRHHKYNKESATTNIKNTFKYADTCHILLYHTHEASMFGLQNANVCTFSLPNTQNCPSTIQTRAPTISEPTTKPTPTPVPTIEPASAPAPEAPPILLLPGIVETASAPIGSKIRFVLPMEEGTQSAYCAIGGGTGDADLVGRCVLRHMNFGFLCHKIGLSNSHLVHYLA